MAKDITFGVAIDASAAQAAFERFSRDVVVDAEKARRELNAVLGGSWEVRTKVIFEDDGSGKKVAKVIREDIATAADEYIRKLNEANKVQKGSLTNLRQALNQAKQARDQISAVADATDIWRSKTGSVNKEWTIANQRVQALQRALDIAGASSFWDRLKLQFNFDKIAGLADGISQAVNSFQSLAIIIQQAGAFVGQFFEATKKLQALGLTFESIGLGANGASTALAEASRISLNLGVDLKSVRASFQQLTPAIVEQGGSLSDVSRITQALSSRFAAFGKSADESKRIIMAVTQAFGKGKLMAEELNQQISEADPAFRTDLANAIGVSVSKLGQMVENGDITAQMLIKVLPLLDKSAILYGKLGNSALDAVKSLASGNVTLAQVEAKINAINQLTIESFANQFKSLMGVILAVQAVFTDFFSAISKAEIFKTLSLAISSIGATIVTVIDVVLKFTALIIQSLDPIASLANAILEWKPAFAIIGTLLTGIATVNLVNFVASSVAAAAALANEVKGFFAGTASLVAYEATKRSLVTAENLDTTAKTLNAAATKTQTGALITNTGTTGASSAATGTKTAATNLNTAATGLNSTAIYANITALGRQITAMATASITMNGLATAAKNVGAAILLGLINAIEATVVALAPLAPALGVLALAAAAVGSLGAAWSVYKGIVKNADTATQTMNNTINQVNDISKRASNGIQSIGEGAKKVEERIGWLNARIDEFKRAWQGLPPVIKAALFAFPPTMPLSVVLSQGTAEVASFSQELDRLVTQGPQLQASLGSLSHQLTKVAEEAKKSNADEAETKRALTDVYQSGLKVYNQQLEAMQAGLASAQATQANDQASKDAKQGLIAEYRNQIAAIEALKAAFQGKAAAMGLAVQAETKEVAQMKEKLELMKQLQKQIELEVQPQIDALKKKKEEEVQALQDIKTKRKEAYDEEIANIQKVEEESRDRYTKENRDREDARTKMTRKYDDELEKLRQVKDQISKTYDQRIETLRGDTPAEARLKALREADLRKQAQSGETPQDRLEAQAQLERMQREKEIAALEKQRKAEEEAAQAAIDAKEKQRQAEQRKDEDDRRKAERAHQDEMDKLKDQRKEKDKAWKTEEKALDKEIGDKKVAYDAEIEALQAKIKEAKNNVKSAQDEINQATNIQLRDEQGIADALTRQRQELEKIKGLKGASQAATGTTATSTPVTVKGMALNPFNPYARPDIKLRFAGGPVNPGSSYVVNELGREAFLSNSGKLSLINAKPFGEWRPPSSGTVIPAHITAGLNIPSGGVSLNTRSATSAVSSAQRSRGTDPIARALNAIANASSGPVTNNVTIQSQSPVKTASDMLVEMTKIKRRRYS